MRSLLVQYPLVLIRGFCFRLSPVFAGFHSVVLEEATLHVSVRAVVEDRLGLVCERRRFLKHALTSIGVDLVSRV